MSTAMKAREKQSRSEALIRLAEMQKYAVVLSSRIESLPGWNKGRRLLEIGAAAGCMTIALTDLGYDCMGIEPDSDALRTARELAEVLDRRCLVFEGCAERLPVPDETFDIVITNSVLEHVSDVDASLNEIARVLTPGGLLWFETASSMCPFQHEIRNFPLFGWYPDYLKKRIMRWAANNRPDLVGYTRAPAIHWFSDRTAQRRLGGAGLQVIADRWQLRLETEGGPLYAAALKVIRSSWLSRRIANIVISECAYAALKPIGD